MVRLTVFVWSALAVVFVAIGAAYLLMRGEVLSRKAFWVVVGVVMGVFYTALIPTIVWANRRQRQIRKEAGTYREMVPAGMRTKGNTIWSLGGSVIGAVMWMAIPAGMAGDWASVALIAAAGVGIWIGSSVIALRKPGRYWGVVIGMLCALGIFSFGLVNLRWERWMAGYRLSAYYEAVNDIPLWVVNSLLGVLYGLLLVLLVMRRAQQGGQAERLS